jgi:uncharacterized protein (DUF1810 family)
MGDPDKLQRFVDAQKSVYQRALAELKNGEKQSHWMWFIFPQIVGLGHSEMARRFAIADKAEALAYLQHPLLGARLRECAQAVLQHIERSAQQIFGSPDDMKLRSCMTLFAQVEPYTEFQLVLNQFYNGEMDNATLTRLAHAGEEEL